MGRIIWGCIYIGIAIAIIKYRRKIHDVTGDFGMLNKYCGSTPDGFTVIAVIIMIVSLMYMTGGLDAFLSGTVGKYFGGDSPPPPTE